LLIGYLSDERYLAIADALVEFERDGESVAIVRSSPRGAIRAALTPGHYRATFAKDGFGPKCSEVDVVNGAVHSFRLLSNKLRGYVWPKWVRSGERGEFRVHAMEAYRLSLWRYGLRKEFVQLLGWHDEHGPRATQQVTPDSDYSQSGAAWNKVGYGSPNHTQLATAPERSGLYYFHAEAESGESYTFPWVVAPATPKAPLAVLASTNTWTTYNSFGGRSHYVNAAGLPETPIVNARQELPRYREGAYNEWQVPDEAYLPLSMERPEDINHIPPNVEVTDPIAGRSGCHVAPAEWRLLGWLEREGFDYDYYSEHQLHSGSLDLDAYKVLITAVHPEYWSADMYHRAKTWVFKNGGRLLYLGGNGLNCEIEFIDDATLRCNSHLPWKDGAPVHESRFGRRVESEANLLGVVFTDPGIMTAAPYEVIDAAHWVFAGTSLKTGDLFGKESLHERCSGGASGHETDKMSPWSPPGTHLLARGTNPDDGGAEMVCLELDSSGKVFSVGSITYVASLLVDDGISRVTKNVLEKFLGE
jgi:N,N-dimethylformamidase